MYWSLGVVIEFLVVLAIGRLASYSVELEINGSSVHFVGLVEESTEYFSV